MKAMTLEMNEYSYKDFLYLNGRLDNNMIEDNEFIYHTVVVGGQNDGDSKKFNLRYRETYHDCGSCPLDNYACIGVHCNVEINI